MTEGKGKRNDNERVENVLLGEIAALLHDTGKLRKEFLTRTEQFHHSKIFEKEDQVDFHFMKKKLSLGESKEYSLYKLVSDHHRKNQGEQPLLLGLLIMSDRKASAEDKQSPRGKQEGNEIYKASPFGIEEKVELDKIDIMREELYRELEKIDKEYKESKDIVELRNGVINAIKDKFELGLGETRRAANDVTLWDHSFATASIFKALLNEAVLNGKFDNNIDPQKHHKRKFTLFAIRFNTLDLLSNTVKIADLYGLNESLSKIRKDITTYIELKLAYGNCIYDDGTTMVFLLPVNFKKKVDLESKLSEKMNSSGIPSLKYGFCSEETTYIYKALPELVDPSSNKFELRHPQNQIKNLIAEWDKCSSNAEICQVCYKYPAKLEQKPGKEKLCETCEKIRSKGSKSRLGDGEGTVWMDEIADETGKIAIVSLNLDLRQWINGDLLSTLLINSRKEVGSDKDSKGGKDFEEIREDMKDLHESLKSENNESAARIMNNYLNFTIGKKNRNEVIDLQKDKIKSIYGKHDSYNYDPEDLLPFLMCKHASSERISRILSFSQYFLIKTFNSFTSGILPVCRRAALKPEGGNSGNWNDGETYPAGIQGLPKTDVVFKDGYFYTTMRLENYGVDPEDIRANLIDEGTKLEYVTEEKYKPFSLVLNTYTTLVCILPAGEAMNFAKFAKAQYDEEFCKVRGRLPFSVHIAYMNRKFPLYLGLRDALKMVGLSSSDTEKSITGEGVELSRLYPEPIIHHVKSMAMKMGDCESDYCYPNFQLRKEPEGELEKYCFEPDYNIYRKPTYPEIKKWYLNLNDAKEGMNFSQKLGSFSFDILPVDDEEKRMHKDDDILMVAYLYEQLKDRNCSLTQLHNFNSFLQNKKETWGSLPDALIEDSIANILRVKKGKKREDKFFDYLTEAAISGSFFTMMGIYYSIAHTTKKESGGDQE